MTTDSSAVRWPPAARLAEIAEENRAALALLDGQARTPVQIFAAACGELLAGLVYETDAEERTRIADLLEAVCAEASRLAAKREAA